MSSNARLLRVKRWATALLALVIVSCSGPLPTGPTGGGSAPQTIACTAENPVSLPGGFQADPQWQTVASGTLQPLLGGTVSGGRYRVSVPPLALSQSTTISIRQYDPDILDFELLPHGIQFLVPVTVEVDYSSTSLDPAAPSCTGGLPIFLWHNDATGIWELVPGVNDPPARKYTVLLSHFSRYAVGKQQGTAEW